MLTIESYGKIENGQLHLHNRQRLDSDLKQAKDCEVVVVIRKRGSKTLKQLGYYWGVVLQEIMLELIRRGNRITIDKVHEAMMLKFYPVHILDDQGIIVFTQPGSTKDFNKEEHADLTEKVRQWAWEALELAIPDPVKNPKLF